VKSTWLLAFALTACVPDAAFHCGSSEQCRNGDTIGTCEATGFCSFPDSSCPSGSRYTASAGGFAKDCVDGLSMGTDSDGDGVADAADNCPNVPNPDQGNEDGDMYGDACDPCPPVADDVFVDSDGDGIDDQCDPHVGVQDHIVLFEGFHHGLPPAWTTSGGVWVADQDGILGTPDTSMHARLEMPYTGMTSVTISAGITPRLLPASNLNGTAGVIGGSDVTDVVTCALYQMHGTTPTQLFEAFESKVGTVTTKPWTYVVDSQYRVELTTDLAQAVDCKVTSGNTSTTTAITLPIALPSDDRNLGVYLDEFSARVDWVMLISE
jgi:Thrombospondin type 3 repeat